ncbi:7787_t:CDS:2, partial [Acaulospora colombiana]
EGSKSPGKSDNRSPAGEDESKQITADDNNKTNKLESEGQSRSSKRQTKSPSVKLLHLRHKVQRLVLKNPEFEESKIGKVMRKIAELKIEPDNYNIIGRSEELIKKWKCLLDTPTTLEGTEEEASPKMAQTEGESPQNEETVKYEENSQAIKTGKEPENKKEEQDRAENSEGNFAKEISSMDVDPVEPRVEEEKHVTEENIVTNDPPSTANGQGGPTNENEVHTKTD